MALASSRGQRCPAFLIIVWLGLSLAGCNSSLEAYPDRVFDLAPSPVSRPDSVRVVSDFYAAQDRRDFRDKLIAERMVAIDLAYQRFQEQLFREGTLRGIATDWTLLGLAGAGTMISSSTTQSVLSAISGGLVGARAAFDKNVLFDRTLPALIANMQASRAEIQLRINQGMQQDVKEYGILQALHDLDAYYNAGSLPGAIVSVAESAGVTKANVERERTIDFRSLDKTSIQLDAMLRTTTGDIDPAKLKLMKSCYRVAGVPPGVEDWDVIKTPEFAIERSKIIECMS